MWGVGMRDDAIKIRSEPSEAVTSHTISSLPFCKARSQWELLLYRHGHTDCTSPRCGVSDK